ncbi:MAG: transposase [Chthonomonadales bacterium]
MSQSKQFDEQITPAEVDALVVPPDPEVIPGKSLFGTRYSKAFKIRILALADQCLAPGELGKVLRQQGITHTTLTAFRKQRAAGYLDAVVKRSDPPDQSKRVMQLERENRKLKRQLEQAGAIIEVQKKVSRLLEISFENHDEKESE